MPQGMAHAATNRFNVSIVIPAYNEAKRIGLTLDTLEVQIKNGILAQANITEVLVVNDGSTDNTVEILQPYKTRLPGFRVIDYAVNQGKGFAVHQGMQHSTGAWILVADADMSTPWTELLKLIEAQRVTQASVVIASRDIDGSKITQHQSVLRESLGKLFNVMIRSLTGLPFRDTQCGFKLIETPIARALAPHLRVHRFAWDVELLMLARRMGAGIAEVPVEWHHRDDSRVAIVRDGVEMLKSVLILRGRTALTRPERFRSAKADLK